MPNWKKVITSGSNADLNQITASAFQFVGSGTAELEVEGHITASGNISGSKTSNLTVGGTVTVPHIHADNFSRTNRTTNQKYMEVANNHDITFGDIDETGNAVKFNVDDTNQKFVFETGFVDIQGTTDATDASGDTGILRVEGGASIAKKLFVGTNLHAAAITASGNISGSAISTGSFGRVEASTFEGSLRTAHQGFITSLGTLTTLTIDDITINGSKISDNGNFTIDGGGDITLDAGDENFIYFLEDETERLKFNLDSTPELDVTGHFTIDCSSDITLDAAGKDISLTDGAGTAEFIFNLEDAPEIDVDGDFTIDGSGLIKLDSATSKIEVVGNITASGDISASGETTSNTFRLKENRQFYFSTDNNEFIYGDGTSLFIGTGGSARVKLDDDNVWFTGHITASQNISSSGHVMASEYKLKSPSGGDEITIFGTNGDGDFVVGDSGMDDELILYGNLAFINIGNGTAGKIGINNNTPISALDITGDLRVSSHTTVQGNISASGDLFIGKTDSAFVSASNGNIQISGSGRGQLEVDYRLFDTGSSHLSSAGGGVGDIVKFGGSSTTAGDVYYLQPAGTWAQAQANAVGTSTGSLAVALGTNSTTDGMLLKGMVKLDNDPSATIGNPVYLDDTTAGHARNDAPDSGGDIVRIVGHYYSGSGVIYFNPDNTFIEVAS